MKATRVNHPNPSRASRTIAGLLLGALAVVSLGACTAMSQAAGISCPADGVRFGVAAPGDPAELEGAYTVLGDALAEELDCSVVVRIIDGHAGLVEAVESGELELAQFSAVGYVVAAERVAVRPVATFGMPNGNLSGYTAGIWVSADSGIASLAQLEGRTLALGARGSTSGDHLPRMALADANLTGDKVLISYAGGHTAALEALRNGSAEAAEIDSPTLAAAVADGTFDPDAYRQIWESGVIPGDPIVLAPGVSEELAEAVPKALLSLSPDVIDEAAAHAGVDPGGRMVGVDEVTYAQVASLVGVVGIGEEDV